MTGSDWIRRFLNDLIEEDLFEAKPGAEDVVALRKEWGRKLTALNAEIEALQYERDELRALVRAQNEKLQGAHDAWERLHVALYGVDG